MIFQRTTALKKIAQTRIRPAKRILICQGGTSAGKTIAIIMYLIDTAQNNAGLTISIVAESLPHLKKGAMKDFLNIMKAHNYYEESRHNKTDHIYNFESGSIIEFYGVEDADKIRGLRRDILFINECNNVPYMVFDQMEVRTVHEIILDFNPVNEFWVNTEVIPHMEHDFLQLTYLDNEGLPPSIKESIESRRHNTNWWKVYGLGEMGIKQGQIYTWELIEAVPAEAELVRRGLDFGYTNSPTAIPDVYKWNNSFIVDEQMYEVGKKNNDIAQFLLERVEPSTIVVADSVEPKSIDEIKAYGKGKLRVIGAVKGADSVNYGIDLLQQQKIYITHTSHNIIKEMRNYMWKIDKHTGKPLNIPEDDWNHALDAIRYAITDIIGVGKSHKYNANRIG